MSVQPQVTEALVNDRYIVLSIVLTCIKSHLSFNHCICTFYFFLFLTFVSCLLTVTLHIVDVRLTCLINITYLLTYLLTSPPLLLATMSRGVVERYSSVFGEAFSLNYSRGPVRPSRAANISAIWSGTCAAACQTAPRSVYYRR